MGARRIKLGWAFVLSLAFVWLIGVGAKPALAEKPPKSGFQYDANGCLTFANGAARCPDVICQRGEGNFVCDPDGSNCRCRPQGAQEDECWVSSGTQVEVKPPGGGPGSTISIGGSIWGGMAEYLEQGSSIDFEFLQESDGLYYYKSNFIHDLGVKDKIKLWQNISESLSVNYSSSGIIIETNKPFEFDGQINITGQYFFAQKKNDNSYHVCEKNSNTVFDLTNNRIPVNIEGAKNLCGEGSRVLKEVFLGTTFSEKMSYSGIMGGCSKSSIEAFSAYLITTPNQIKKVAANFDKNYFMGRIFNANETKSERDKKIKEIKDACQDTCKNKNKLLIEALDAEEFCRNCNSPLLDLLAKNPKDSFQTILAKHMAKGESCDGFNYSTGRTDNSSYTSPHTEGEEGEVNKQLPAGLAEACDQTFPSDNANRLKCKTNFLKCYNDESAENDSGDICTSMTGQLKTSRWIICPVVTATTAGAEGANRNLEKILSLQNNLIDQTRPVWQQVRNWANIVIVIMGLVMIISQIIGYGLSNYQIKQLLPKLFITIVFVNISFDLCRIAIEISNILGADLYGLFSSYANEIKPSGVDIKVLVTGGVLAIGGGALFWFFGGLALIAPLLVTIILSAAFLILILSFRSSAIIILSLLSPLAIVSALVPGMEKTFKKWLRTFVTLVMLYPVAALILGAGKLSGMVIYSSFSNPFIQLIGITLPLATSFLVPKAAIDLVKGAPMVGAAISQAINSGRKAADTSTLNQALRHQHQRAYQRRTSTGVLGGIQQSKAFNALTFGAGKRNIVAYESAQRREQAEISRLLGNNTDLMAALITGDKELFNNLSGADQEKYRQIATRYDIKSENFNIALSNSMSKNGVENYELYMKTYNNLSEAGWGDRKIERLQRSHEKNAMLSGYTRTWAILNEGNNYLWRDSEGKTAKTYDLNHVEITPPKPIEYTYSNFNKPISLDLASAGITRTPTPGKPTPTHFSMDTEQVSYALAHSLNDAFSQVAKNTRTPLTDADIDQIIQKATKDGSKALSAHYNNFDGVTNDATEKSQLNLELESQIESRYRDMFNNTGEVDASATEKISTVLQGAVITLETSESLNNQSKAEIVSAKNRRQDAERRHANSKRLLENFRQTHDLNNLTTAEQTTYQNLITDEARFKQVFNAEDRNLNRKVNSSLKKQEVGEAYKNIQHAENLTNIEKKITPINNQAILATVGMVHELARQKSKNMDTRVDNNIDDTIDIGEVMSSTATNSSQQTDFKAILEQQTYSTPSDWQKAVTPITEEQAFAKAINQKLVQLTDSTIPKFVKAEEYVSDDMLSPGFDEKPTDKQYQTLGGPAPTGAPVTPVNRPLTKLERARRMNFKDSTINMVSTGAALAESIRTTEIRTNRRGEPDLDGTPFKEFAEQWGTQSTAIQSYLKDSMLEVANKIHNMQFGQDLPQNTSVRDALELIGIEQNRIIR